MSGPTVPILRDNSFDYRAHTVSRDSREKRQKLKKITRAIDPHSCIKQPIHLFTLTLARVVGTLRGTKSSLIMASIFLGVLASLVPAVRSSSLADVDLREFASAASAARQEARLHGRNGEQHHRLSLRHLEAMWHTSLGTDVRGGVFCGDERSPWASCEVDHEGADLGAGGGRVRRMSTAAVDSI